MFNPNQKPVPTITTDNKTFWEYMKKHEFSVQKCKECGELTYPPSAACHNCLSPDFEWMKLSGKGKVYSFVVVRRAGMPAFAAEVPYVVAIIETEEGVRYSSNIIECDPDEVYIDMPVEVVYEDVNDKITLPKFRPVK
ncbi:MAG: Zn-ribbon domain-containing OB-fold protein [Dehalococcoidales bacterium]|nr:Zn-ribbon domain-containing OB-fold protein [Dehalococcoidales bacterium]